LGAGVPDHARAFDFLRSFAALSADAVEPLPPYGQVLRTPTLPAARNLNCLVVTVADPALDATDLVRLASDVLSGAPEPQFVVEDDATGERLEGPLLRAGWHIERALLMTLGPAPAVDVDRSAVRDGTEDETVALMSRWYAEEESDQGPEVLRQLDAYARREAQRVPQRRFVVDHGGGAAGSCTLRARDGVAQVEDVFVAPELRGRGAGTALVAHAAAVSRSEGHDLTIIVADADGRAKRLYERLGFEAGPTFRTFWRAAR
jgi:ribosomal protein S18 acetylase RimI-like enzyme